MSYYNPNMEHNERALRERDMAVPDFEDTMTGITKNDFSLPERLEIRCHNGHLLMASAVCSNCDSEFDIQGAACGGPDVHICYDCWDNLPEEGSQ